MQFIEKGVSVERLNRDTYLQDTRIAARRLLGCTLVRMYKGKRLAGRIVEAEAYMGPEDLGAHSARGRTPRTEAMFGPPGHAYVYLIYGMYNCMNVVTQREGTPHAVLLRAIEPVDGIDTMRELRRNRRTGSVPKRDTQIASGPGKLCQALAITRDLYGADLVDGDMLWIETGPPVPDSDIETGPRIGIDYAGDWTERPLRFWVRGNQHVSK